MKPKKQSLPPIVSSVTLLALTAAIPLAVAAEVAGVPVARQGVIGATASHDRAETLARCVNEVARRFCSAQVCAWVAPLPAGSPAVLQATRTIHVPDEVPSVRPLLINPLIDLPPPAL